MTAPHLTRRSMTSLTIGGLLAIGGFGNGVLPAAGAPAAPQPVPAPHGANPMDISVAAADFQKAMRDIWDDHVAWTRLVIVSFVADLPDLEATTNRLLENPGFTADAVRPYYGDEAADQLGNLLSDHLKGAIPVLDAAKAGDEAALKTAQEAWYANADEIAVFLNGANPDNWPLADLKMHMKMHLDLTTQEAVHRLKGEYAEDIASYDEVHKQIMVLADALSSGIIAQFPDKFA